MFETTRSEVLQDKSVISINNSNDEVDNEDIDNDTDATSDEGEDDELMISKEDEMPLWFYTRFGHRNRSPAAASVPVKSTSAEKRSTSTNSMKCTCIIMGKVILNSHTLVPQQQQNQTSPLALMLSDNATNSLPYSGTDVSLSNWNNTPVYIVIAGYSNGTIRVTEASTGMNLLRSNTNATAAEAFETDPVWTIEGFDTGTNESSSRQRQPIVSVSVDATGTVIAAMDSAGNACIWTIKYSLSLRRTGGTATVTPSTSADGNSSSSIPTNNSNNGGSGGGGGLLSKLFWNRPNAPTVTTGTTALVPTTVDSTSTSTSTSTTTSGNETTRESTLDVPTLSIVMAEPHCKVQRVSYSYSEFGGRPTCFCLDPAYKQHETPSSQQLPFPLQQQQQKMVVAFDTGKLVLSSRRGGTWRMRLDHALLPYTGPPITNEDWRGIEALAWRGHLLAFCDCSGVKLYDTATLSPVAHVDRPIGARPSLYPGVRVVPHLTFETSRQLLVAWGDCLLALTVMDSAGSSTTEQGGEISQLETAIASGRPTNVSSPQRPHNTTSKSPTTATMTRKRTVACTMAWGLDCVAAGVVPLDARHVVVLGQRIAESYDTNDTNQSKAIAVVNDEGVEMQILDRSTGGIVYADLLELEARPNDGSEIDDGGDLKPSQYRLLSSFAIPRSEDAVEATANAGLFGGHVTTVVDDPEVDIRSTLFSDSHLQWSLNDVSYEDYAADETTSPDDDADSVDSDDYSFIIRSKPPEIDSEATSIAANEQRDPPLLVLASTSDLVVARMRHIDDAMRYAREHNKMALALRMALPRVRQLRQHTIGDLVNSYLRAALRLPSPIHTAATKTLDGTLTTRSHLSLRRVKIVAQALPVLLGGNVSSWNYWISELEKIPGALFVIRNIIPVRDPKLPKDVYARIVSLMLDEVNSMQIATRKNATGTTGGIEILVAEGESHFVDALLAWGPTHTMREHIRLYESQEDDQDKLNTRIQRITRSLSRRYEQTAVGYLNVSSDQNVEKTHQAVSNHHVDSTDDALYSIDAVIDLLSRGTWLDNVGVRDGATTASSLDSRAGYSSHATLDALARLYMMKGCHDVALKCFLILGILYANRSTNEIEEAAISVVNNENLATRGGGAQSPYSFVVKMIERYHLHECLLDEAFLPPHLSCSPISALVRLVNLEVAGVFLIENCVAPPLTSISSTASKVIAFQPEAKNTERRGTLPLDLVTGQLSGSPQLLHWYLHLAFRYKPELYVVFANTANPPISITQLHKKHLDLYIKYAGKNRDSTQALAGIEAYRVVEKSTPLLSFLRAVLPIGVISPAEVGKLLAIERRGGAGMSSIFALELAYIMETFGNDSESDAQMVLELYLMGSMSIMLAVMFAQRTGAHSLKLWQILVDYCVSSDIAGQGEGDDKGESNPTCTGVRFGELLEAAALCGADLAKLVSQIPPGMKVEGLRPRMVAAVADYRLKVELYSHVRQIAAAEQELLYQEAALRSRRGIRVDGLDETFDVRYDESFKTLPLTTDSSCNDASVGIPHTSIRRYERRSRQSSIYALR